MIHHVKGRDNPELYAHIWEGEPDDEGTTHKVLPYHLLSLCVDDYEQYADGCRGQQPDVGLDIADVRADYSALFSRGGPVILTPRSGTHACWVRQSNTTTRTRAPTARNGSSTTRSYFYEMGAYQVRGELLKWRSLLA